MRISDFQHHEVFVSESRQFHAFDLQLSQQALQNQISPSQRTVFLILFAFNGRKISQTSTKGTTRAGYFQYFLHKLQKSENQGFYRFS